MSEAVMPARVVEVIKYLELDALQRPLLAKFYKAHGSKMRGANQTSAFVARAPQILAALCLTTLPEGHWLTGLLVAPAYRNQGIAHNLLHTVRCNTEGKIWLFCKPELLVFYNASGYEPALELPHSLQEKLQRYQQTKSLIALVNQQ